MLNLLKDLGVSAVFVALLVGLTCGAYTTHFFMQREVDAHLAEVGALRTQLNQLQSFNKEWQETGCQQIKVQLDQSKIQAQTLAQWNAQWSDANAELARNNALWQQRDALAHDLERLREKWQGSTYAIKQFTSGHCPDNSNTCDLNLLDQRKLRALEAERDQLNMQLLDMQTRIACVK